MRYTFKEQQIIKQVVAETNARLRQLIGKPVEIKISDTQKPTNDDVYQLLGELAEVLGGNVEDFSGGRNERCVDMKCLAYWAIKQLFPGTTLQEMGSLFGIHHASVLNIIKRHDGRVGTNHEPYLLKFNKAKKVVADWKQRHKPPIWRQDG